MTESLRKVWARAQINTFCQGGRIKKKKKVQRILRFRMGSHLLPIEQGRHLRLPCHRRVCRLCHTGALGDERHMLLECPALADLRDEFSPLIAECSGVMARLVWARNQPMVSRYIIACLDRMSCW